MSTPIADLVRRMHNAGIAIDVIIDAVETVERAGQRKRDPVHRGERLPANWQPTESAIAFAVERGMSRGGIELELEKFRNYWSAKTGQSATKLDWEATWRNWILRALDHGLPDINGRGRADRITRSAPTGNDAILAGMGRLARRLAQDPIPTGPSGRQMARGPDVAHELDLEPNRT
jgi:DnaT DNA-binding domain